MSRDLIVLTPNGRRLKVHCTPDTSILQVLEDACQKYGVPATDYDLKHHNHILDLTTTIRFSNLPNKATLELVEAENKRKESNVTVGLLLEDGDRRTAEFSPSTSLYDLITSLAPTEFNSLQQPTILYMRQEVIGIDALKVKTLRQLGLIGGRAILRLLNKAEEPTQANVSAVYRCPLPKETDSKKLNTEVTNDDQKPPSDDNAEVDQKPLYSSKKTDDKGLDPVALIKKEKQIVQYLDHKGEKQNENENDEQITKPIKDESTAEPNRNNNSRTSETSSLTPENLERRLKIEEEVTFLGAQKAIAFMQPEDKEDELEDLPDDFYELTIEEVRKLYGELQQRRSEMENTPLVPSSKRELDKQISQQKLDVYKNVVVRIQFPDRMILQGVFSPTDTIEDINNFVKSHLQNPEKPFHIFTTPFKETLDPKMTLLDAKFVPCVHMHFKWTEEDTNHPYLKDEIYLKKTSSDAASILASKYRAPSRRKMDDAKEVPSQKSGVGSSSTSKNSRVPKWFKK